MFHAYGIDMCIKHSSEGTTDIIAMEFIPLHGMNNIITWNLFRCKERMIFYSIA